MLNLVYCLMNCSASRSSNIVQVQILSVFPMSVNWLVHDVHAGLSLKKRQILSLGVVGGVSSKDLSTYLSPTNIPMMANYPSYTATWHTRTTSGTQYRCVGGRGTGHPHVLVLCCGAAWVFRSQHT